MANLKSTNAVTITVSSPSGCPPNAVPVNSLGLCPQGYTYDANNPLCCIPQCPPQSCPAGQRWSSDTCSCLYIPVNSISAPPIYKTTIAYNITLSFTGTKVAFGVLPEGTVSCEGYFGNTGTAGGIDHDYTLQATRVFKFKVLDANGNPIPYAKLTFSNDQLFTNGNENKYAVNTAYLSGEAVIGGALPGETDANGNGIITLFIYMTPTNIPDQANGFVVVQKETTALITGSIEVTANNGDTGAVSATLSFEINLLFCLNWAALF